MTPERIQPLAFDAWKLQLRKDCALRDKLYAFNSMGDYVLSLLWERGVEPSVAGILRRGRIKSQGTTRRIGF